MRLLRGWLMAFTVLVSANAEAQDPDYRLTPRQIAEDTYVVEGRNEDFSTLNGGHIVNTAFVVTSAGVVVIDTGPTARFGSRLREAIRRTTPLPVVRVFNTHHHPDHWLGNQAFPDLAIETAPRGLDDQRREGPAFLDNTYRLLQRWAAGTELHPATRAASAGTFVVGGHRFEVLLTDGHTGADLAVLDRTTGVLFAGDLVFHGRAPTVPHADAEAWLRSLERLRSLSARLVVPGHGAVTEADSAIGETADYLRWLHARLTDAAAAGLDITEALGLPIPPRFRGLAVIDAEYPRSVLQWYPALERRALETSSPPADASTAPR